LTTSSPDTFTPFLSRPIFSFQRYHTLNDNCAVMQHCTHMNFFSIFWRQIKLYFSGIYSPLGFLFFFQDKLDFHLVINGHGYLIFLLVFKFSCVFLVTTIIYQQ
ncbi:unnamed protein product, partial [Staurois parvus]